MAICEYQSERLKGINARRYSIDILKEFFRKSIHFCTGLVPLCLKYFYEPTLVLLFAVLVFYIVCETLRCNGHNIPIMSAITSAAARKRDENKFVMGPVTLTLGVIAAASLFDAESAAIGIYALAFGDGLASLVGKICGRSYLYKLNGKTAEGSLACFTAIFISCFLVTKVPFTALLIAFVGMFIELLPLKDYDNIVIPIALAFIHQFLL